LFIPIGKTKAARRRIPLTSKAMAVLQLRIKNAKGEYLFSGGRGGYDTEKPVVKLNNAHYGTMDRANIRNFRIYDLRHTFASRMAMAGVDLVTLAALLGHSRVQMVMRYAHPVEEHKIEAIQKLENYNIARQKAA
jgi:integrase